MKPYILILFLLTGYQAFGQKQRPKTERLDYHGHGVDFAVLPLLLYNTATVGWSKKLPSRWEHAVSGGASLSLFYIPNFSMNVNYNLNYYFKNHKGYIPAWVRISNNQRSVSFEEGYFPNTWRYALGSGIGRSTPLGGSAFLRTELGLGAALNLTNPTEGTFGSRIRFWEYAIEERDPDDHPPIIPAVKVRITLMFRNFQGG